jgi:hypothetical protein
LCLIDLIHNNVADNATIPNDEYAKTGLFTKHLIFNHAFNAPADTILYLINNKIGPVAPRSGRM